MDYAKKAAIFKALGDETRLKIVEMLVYESLCACKILEAFDITQPTLCYHMKVLNECGLVNCRKEGKWCRYSVNKDDLAYATSIFNLEVKHAKN